MKLHLIHDMNFQIYIKQRQNCFNVIWRACNNKVIVNNTIIVWGNNMDKNGEHNNEAS